MKNTFIEFRKVTLLFCLAFCLSGEMASAAGGYDQGTPAGKEKLVLDFTINPGNRIEAGQSYVVWGYGLTDRLDFHGYISHESTGINQIYYGLMYNFYSNDWLDLSTALGFRDRLGITDIFLPQLLATVKLSKGFDIIGSAVNVYNTANDFNRGVALDVALRIPLPNSFTPSIIKEAKLSLGGFQGAGKTKWNPTYSLDFEF